MKIFTLLRLTRLGPAQALLTILLGFLLLHLVSSPASAQGSCSCEEWQGPVRLICIPVDTCDDDFIPSEVSCPTEFAAPYGCKEGATCACVLGSAAPCTEAEGYCMVSCGPDYDSYPPGDPECVAAGAGMCCTLADSVTPPCNCGVVDACGTGETCDYSADCDAVLGLSGLCVGEEEDGPTPTPICIETPIGCLPTDLGEAAAHLFGIFAWIIGLIAIIIFIIGGYQVMIGGDDPERLQEGRAKMTAAVTGLFFLLLFVALIRIIGVEILGIDALREVIKPW